MNKEKIYDDQIFPLMAKIIDICKENKIAMIANFALGPHPDNPDDPDDQLVCSTVLLADEFEPTKKQVEAWKIFKPEPVVVLAETIETKTDGRKHITITRIS